MPFGLSTCPSTFQRFINTVFRDLVVQGIVLPYMDDIVILAKNESEAIERLKKFFKCPVITDWEINFDKCQFLHRKIEFLGHIIENNKLFPSPSKTKSVVNYPEPKTTKEVQRFLGLTGYFRKFIPAYSVIAKPLSDLYSGKQEGFLHPLVKDDIPLNTYHIDHLGPLATSSKNYKFILAVIDSFTKFVWLYPTKTTSTSEVIKKLDIQKTTFGNPRFLITDRGTTFTSDEFHTYCSEQKITLHHITTGLPRANGQVERINRTIIPVLSKMSEDDPTKWFKHVPSLQEVLNSTFQRSISTTPFELLFGTQINNKTDLRIQQLIDEQLQLEFNENRELLHYVEVRHPQTTSNILQTIDKYEERFLNRRIRDSSQEFRDTNQGTSNRFPNRKRQDNWRELRGNNQYSDNSRPQREFNRFEGQDVADNWRFDSRRRGVQSDHRFHNPDSRQGDSRIGAFRGQNDQNI
ncbi:retrovirus-related Pol polyprotein from transposon 297 [Trichonephila clavipes]|nr:retrovirus-related Pol polyprotein from transposon 297 [Trichonephila clavipes]